MKREDVLMEALPYFQQFHGKTIVIKLGGHAMVDPVVLENAIRDAVLLLRGSHGSVPAGVSGLRYVRSGREIRGRHSISSSAVWSRPSVIFRPPEPHRERFPQTRPSPPLRRPGPAL